MRSVRLGVVLGFVSSLLLGPGTTAASAPALVSISPGPQITNLDLARFDTRWMSSEQMAKRLDDTRYALKNRQVEFAWGIFDTTMAMTRMYDLTHKQKYLDHLRDVNDIVLQYRDDKHPGDDFPQGDSPICLTCQPPFIDHEHGRVMAAWGSGLVDSDFVDNGGLTPVEPVISGVYAYGLASFARIVAGDPKKHAVYGADAMRYANAVMETFWAFMPDLDSRQAGAYVEGTFNAPAIYPTASQCRQAQARAQAHAHTFAVNRDELDARLKAIDTAKSHCDNQGKWAGKPLPYNQSGALMMAFIELSYVLDSNFYKSSPLRNPEADLTRGTIPLVVTRHQRYFNNRLDLKLDPAQGDRYSWHYRDGVSNPSDEDTSHGNLDMMYVKVLRDHLERLNARVAPAEPIALDDAMLRRFADTFLTQIARPSEIDGGRPAQRCQRQGRGRQRQRQT